MMERQHNQSENQKPQHKDHQYVKEKKGGVMVLGHDNNDVPFEINKQQVPSDLDVSLNSLMGDLTVSDASTAGGGSPKRHVRKGFVADDVGDGVVLSEKTSSELPCNIVFRPAAVEWSKGDEIFRQRRHEKNEDKQLSTSTATTSQIDLSLSLNLSGITEEGEIVATEELGATDNEIKLSRYIKNEKRIDFWNQIVYQRTTHYGMFHVRTAESLLDLGTELLNCKKYDAAIVSLEQSLQILRKAPKKKSELKIARALDMIGVVASQAYRQLDKDQKYVLRATEALEESYDIRCRHLGPDHIDTVETLNKIAGVHLNMKCFQLAKDEYNEVLRLRNAIYGPDHPSIGVTERFLGRIHLHLNEYDEARLHFVNSLRIFENLGLNFHSFAKQVKEQLQHIGVIEARLEI